MRPRYAAALAVLAVGVCAVAGGLNGPQRPGRALWYVALRKPRVTPPGPVVGATWGGLELLLAAAGYRLLADAPSPGRNAALAGWAGTLLGLAGYPWLFFRERRLRAATAASAAMLASAAVTAVAGRRDRTVSVLMAPVVAWLGFATFLSARIGGANPRLSAD